MNYNLKKEWPLLVILAIPLIIAILVYPHMPERVPIHWDINGQPNNYGSRTFGTFFMPLLNVAMYVLLLVMPKLDPKRANYSKFGASYIVVRYSLHIFFLLMFGVTVAASMGYPVNIGKWVPVGVSVLIIVLGNVMGRVRHNYFVGFRYPWTLANEEVWRRTHQLGAKWLVGGGFVALLGALFTNGTASFVIMMIGIFTPVVVTMVYSYVIYKKLEK